MAYDEVSDLKDYCKGKRKPRTVILGDDELPRKCVICGKLVEREDGGNRTKVYPENEKIAPMHYECAWESLFEKASEIAREIR